MGSTRNTCILWQRDCEQGASLCYTSNFSPFGPFSPCLTYGGCRTGDGAMILPSQGQIVQLQTQAPESNPMTTAIISPWPQPPSPHDHNHLLMTSHSHNRHLPMSSTISP